MEIDFETIAYLGASYVGLIGIYSIFMSRNSRNQLVPYLPQLDRELENKVRAMNKEEDNDELEEVCNALNSLRESNYERRFFLPKSKIEPAIKIMAKYNLMKGKIRVE